MEAITCHRCGRQLDPERTDLDGWLVLDTRKDGWVRLPRLPDARRARARPAGFLVVPHDESPGRELHAVWQPAAAYDAAAVETGGVACKRIANERRRTDRIPRHWASW
jgi:hypothetical protein